MRHRLASVIALLVLTSCGTDPTPPQGEPAGSAPSITPAELPESNEHSLDGQAAREVAPEPAPEFDVEQVITATVLIASGGDLEAAITGGLIGEAEAEAAIAALESGSIDHLFDNEADSISR